MSQEETHDLEQIGTEWAEATATDLSGLFGIDFSISGPSILNTNRDKLLPKSGSIVASQCEIADQAETSVYVVVPLSAAIVLAAAQEKQSPDALGELEESGFTDEVAASYRSAMDVCVGILGRVLDEEAGLPALSLGESKAAELPDCDPSLPDGLYRCARFEFEAEGFPKQSVDVLFEADLASQWFGEMESNVDSTTEARDLRIALLDPCPDSREEFDSIAAEIGAHAMTLEPSEVGPETNAELADFEWLVITWDLGGRLGLELLERFRTQKATRHLQFAIASPAPTRSMIDAALRWGAQTVLYQPWDANEILERLTDSK